MKQNRDMFYSDYNFGGYGTPAPNMMPQNPNVYQQSSNMVSSPNMFNQNGNMMAAGPNVMMPMNPGVNPQMGYVDTSNDLEARVTKLERAVKKLESKIKDLESLNLGNNVTDVEVNSSMYMI